MIWLLFGIVALTLLLVWALRREFKRIERRRRRRQVWVRMTADVRAFTAAMRRASPTVAQAARAVLRFTEALRRSERPCIAEADPDVWGDQA